LAQAHNSNRKSSIANNMPQLNWNQHFGNCGIIY